MVLPPGLQPFDAILMAILAFIDGLLFGLAVKKGIVSFVLLIVAILLGTYIGISLPGISAQALMSRAASLVVQWISSAPAIFSGVSILFIIGIAIGIWKG
ncbi:MAG: hypothetical protein ACP5RJ_07330 [Conexivisphaera sp.]